MVEKCSLCKEELQTTFLDKRVGTVLKTGSGESSEAHIVCSSCQKQYKEGLKEQFS